VGVVGFYEGVRSFAIGGNMVSSVCECINGMKGVQWFRVDRVYLAAVTTTTLTANTRKCATFSKNVATLTLLSLQANITPVLLPQHCSLRPILTRREYRKPQKSRTKIHLSTRFTLSTWDQWTPLLAYSCHHVSANCKASLHPHKNTRNSSIRADEGLMLESLNQLS